MTARRWGEMAPSRAMRLPPHCLLAHRGAMDKLVNFMGYPEEIKGLPDYDPNYFQAYMLKSPLSLPFYIVTSR